MLKNLKLGDKLEALIKAIIPKAIIKKVQEKEGEDGEEGCGCAKRKKWLNNLT